MAAALDPRLHGTATSAAYVRFSDANSNPRSLDDQLAQVLRRARQDEEFVPWEYVFADFAITGTTGVRGSYIVLNGLLAQESSPVRTIYVDEFSRGGRDKREWLAFAELVETWGRRRICGASDGFDSSQPNSQFMVGILSTFSQQTSRDIGTRVRRGMLGAARRETVIGRVPLGYRKVPFIDAQGRPVLGKDGEPLNTMEIEPPLREQLRRIFLDRAARKSVVSIARRMNQERIGGSNRWTVGKVLQILDRSASMGVWSCNLTYTAKHPETGRKQIRRRPATSRSAPRCRTCAS